MVTTTILDCCGYINKTFCWANKVFFTVKALLGLLCRIKTRVSITVDSATRNALFLLHKYRFGQLGRPEPYQTIFVGMLYSCLKVFLYSPCKKLERLRSAVHPLRFSAQTPSRIADLARLSFEEGDDPSNDPIMVQKMWWYNNTMLKESILNRKMFSLRSRRWKGANSCMSIFQKKNR